MPLATPSKKAAGRVGLPFAGPKIGPDQQNGGMSDTVLDPNISNTSGQQQAEKSATAPSLERPGVTYEVGPHDTRSAFTQSALKPLRAPAVLELTFCPVQPLQVLETQINNENLFRLVPSQ